MKHLVTNDFIDGFRKPNQPGYGPHLGFDYRRMEDFLEERFFKNGELELVEKSFTGFRMNLIYVLRKRR